MKQTTMTWRVWLWIGVWAASAAMHASAATADEIAEQLLADRFTDPSFGYSLKPPVASHIDRRKRALLTGGYQLVQFDKVEFLWTTTVSVHQTSRPIPAREVMRELEKPIFEKHPDREILEADSRIIAGRPSHVLVTRYKDANKVVLRQVAVIPFDDKEVFCVTMSSPAHDADTVRPLFKGLLDSFEFVHSELTHQMLDAGMVRGKELLEQISARGVADKIVPDMYLLIRIDNENAGYATIHERVGTQNGVNGVFIDEEAWIFFGDGVIDRMNNRYFLANDLQSELFELRLQRFTPARNGRIPRVIEQLDRGVKENDRLVLAYTEQSGDGALTNEVLAVPSSYLPKAAHRMLTRLLPLDKSRLYCFASYNTQQRNLVMHTIWVEPVEAVSPGTEGAIRYKVLDGEGVVPPYTEVYCDTNGEIVKVVAGQQTFVRTSPQTIERLFGRKVGDAQAKIGQTTGGKP